MSQMADEAKRALRMALIALACPVLSVLLFRAGISVHFTNNRVFDALIALPLVTGAYCGIAAFRAKGARIAARTAGLAAALVCVPYAAMMVFVTIFGLA